MNSLKGPGVAVAVRFEVLWSHRDGGLEHLHEHHVAHHPEQTCHDKWSKHIKLAEQFRGEDESHRSLVQISTSQDCEDGSKSVEQLSPALRGGTTGPDAQLHRQQRAADQQQPDVHELQRKWQPHHCCGVRRRQTWQTVIWILKQSANREQSAYKYAERATNPFTFFRTWSQGIKPSALLV